MTNQELKRLVRLEERIMQIAVEEMGLVTCPLEFDVVPAQKLLEIMSYSIPTNCSSWKFGRDYEKARTIYENVNPSLPYEVIINNDPARAYLMKTNTFAIQVLIIAHCVGHSSFFTMNEFFKNTRKDIMDFMSEATLRFNKYEKKYGIDAVEKIVDAGHALYFHSSPFDNETEIEKLKRIFKQERKEAHAIDKSQFGILSNPVLSKQKPDMDIELYNSKLYQDLKDRTPIEPTEDFLRYIIDNSLVLEDWSRDILETLREVGRYFWPQMKTKFANEGFACVSGDTLIDTSIGIITAEDIVESDDNISVYDGNSYKRIIKKFKNVNKHRVKIKTKNGFILHGGFDHKIMIHNNWKQLNKLKIGDTFKIKTGNNTWSKKYNKINYEQKGRLTQREICKEVGIDLRTVNKVKNNKKVLNRNSCILKAGLALSIMDAENEKSIGLNARTKINIPKICDEKLATYLGYMIGDGNIGYINKRKHYQMFTTGDAESRDHFNSLFIDLFGINPVIKKDENRYRIISHHGNITDFLVNELNMKYGICAGTKEIPNIILTSPKSVVAAFLRSYFDADGHVDKNGTVILITKSKVLSRQVQNVLLKFGIFSKRVLQKADDCYRLTISGLDSLCYKKEIGFNLSRKMEFLNLVHSKKRWYWNKSYNDTIISIKHDFGKTYDFTVEDTHKYCAGGFLNHNCLTHEKIMNQLFEEDLLNSSEHAQFNYSNSLVKGKNPTSMNPYLIGSRIWEDVIDRWDKGKHGDEYNNLTNQKEKEDWDTKDGKGFEKVLSCVETYTDWFMMQDFLTTDLVKELDLYIYFIKEEQGYDDFIIGVRDAQKIKNLIVRSFAYNGMPKIQIINGDHNGNGGMMLKHSWEGQDLDIKYAKETMRHIYNIWGKPISIRTKDGKKDVVIAIDPKQTLKYENQLNKILGE